MIKTAILGYGTVGSGVAEVLRKNREVIRRHAGDEVQTAYVLDLREFPGDPVEEILVHEYEPILNDPDVRIVVETMGGLHPAYEFTKQALQAGKSVCTSNKELVAEHGVELMKIAEEHQANYMFEASCGGGIPVIRAMQTGLAADEIDAVTGILNGTTNYILTRMEQDGCDFGEALAEAQRIGYAERNPEADIEGYDAKRKIAILSSVAYGSHVDYTKVFTEGISRITTTDMQYAAALSARIKLLGRSVRRGNDVSVMVAPMLVFRGNPLYDVNGVMNAIFVHGNMLGDAMFYGSGAGSLPTASAVSADIVDCAKNLGKNTALPGTGETLNVCPADEAENAFFVRVGADEAVKAEACFGKIRSVTVPGIEGEAAFTTEVMTEAAFREKLQEISDVKGYIRICR
ncbi:MAG: homoserine dehydrogenase [Eubacterium sp.]|nr:homoserine dehydrogenase [Eubacterium sp.]